MTTLVGSRRGPLGWVYRRDLMPADESPPLGRGMRLWLLGTVVLLPVRFLPLPFNMELLDIWVLVGLPIAWLVFFRRRESMSVAYAVPLGLIVLSSLISTFGAVRPSNSLIVLMKELFLFAWFAALTHLCSRLTGADLRRFLHIWSVMVLLHGAILIAQFLSPELWHLTARLAGRSVSYANFRPSGLFFSAAAGDTNFAAIFQLLGFVPLVLVGYSARTTILGGGVLLLSMLATGSMGAALAFAAGLTASLLGITLLTSGLRVLWSVLLRLTMAGLCLGGAFYFVMASNPDSQSHFDEIFLGRSEKSSEGRFDIWRTGTDVLMERDAYLWGIGPENFRVVDDRNKQLHNDLIAFVVERGVFAGLGLVLLFATALVRAAQVLRVYSRFGRRPRLEVIVLLAAVVGLAVESLTHQVFHTRELWLILAVQEGMHYRAAAGKLFQWGSQA